MKKSKELGPPTGGPFFVCIDIEPYGRKLYFVVAENTRQGIDFLNKKKSFGIDSYCDDCGGMVISLTYGNSCLVLEDNPKILENLVHELSHVCLDTLTYVGLKNIQIEQEPYAYLMSHLFEKCFTFLKKNYVDRKF